jgi:hypothetical protein
MRNTPLTWQRLYAVLQHEFLPGEDLSYLVRKPSSVRILRPLDEPDPLRSDGATARTNHTHSWLHPTVECMQLMLCMSNVGPSYPVRKPHVRRTFRTPICANRTTIGRHYWVQLVLNTHTMCQTVYEQSRHEFAPGVGLSYPVRKPSPVRTFRPLGEPDPLRSDGATVRTNHTHSWLHPTVECMQLMLCMSDMGHSYRVRKPYVRRTFHTTICANRTTIGQHPVGATCAEYSYYVPDSI